MRTHEAAKSLGISATTVRRWLKERRLPEPKRTPAGWREFEETDLIRLRKLLKSLHGGHPTKPGS